jgi:hypothetical protein
MIRLPKSVASFGAVALAAGVFTLAVPRAAHSFAAALVQVSNTAASPAITQSANGQAAQLVHLATENCEGYLGGGFLEISPAGTFASNAYFVVPTNPPQSLVITDMDFTQDPTAGPNTFGLGNVMPPNQNNLVVERWNLSGGATSHFQYRSGIVFGPGSTLTLVPLTQGNCPGTVVDLHGYLTSD